MNAAQISATGELAARFETKFCPEPNTGCWLWAAFTQPSGYGRFSVMGRMTSAHRVSWSIYRGPVPSGMWVLHRCDTPPCVNPEHLFLGTHVENMADMLRKGRAGWIARPETVPRGELHGCAKLSSLQVVDIRARYTSGERQPSIARAFGVSRSTVGLICQGKIWKESAPK